MMKLDVFDEIVEIMRKDSATCKDIQGGDSDFYRSQIKEDMDDDAFIFIVKSYLVTFGLTGHLNFFSTESKGGLGFQVMRYQDTLYVVNCAEDAIVRAGDKITHIEGMPVKIFGEKYQDFLRGESEERQGIHWGELLRFFSEMTVVRGQSGNQEVVPILLKKYTYNEEPYYCKQIRDDMVYMRLEDFNNEEQIQGMYREYDELICKTPYLVIDVRGNGGGMDSAFFPLLKYCLPEGYTLNDLNVDDGGAEVNFTERNVGKRLKMYAAYKQMDVPQETLDMIIQMEQEAKENYGKGFMKCCEDPHIPIEGAAVPNQVFILTDSRCGSSGDSFVQIMRHSPKVTVVGRPTMGILDYSNCIFNDYGAYTFMYPTSRLLNIDKGICMTRNGVPVDSYVEWTPEHLQKDMDMEKVLELIKNRP
ncbi:MAG: S41 family peptidase [Cellulosilyticaceae bacterium]